jgi:hypothetical protein
MAWERPEEIVDNPERKHPFGFIGGHESRLQGEFSPST